MSPAIRPEGGPPVGPLVIRRAELDGRLVDVHVGGGTITAVVDHAGRASTPHADELDAAGGAVLPGIHDHHVHLLAAAAARTSVAVGPPEITGPAAFAAALRAADERLAPGAWIRAVGYHESVAGELDAALLDRIVGRRPVRVQHRSGAMWVLNGAALRIVELGGPIADDERRTGRVLRGDEWLRARIGAAAPDLAGVGRDLVAHGVTGVTDLTPTSDPGAVELLAGARRRGDLPQRLLVTGSAALPADAAADLPRGPVKIVIPDHAPVELDLLLAEVAAARALRRPVAIHAVTRAALVLAVVALREVPFPDGGAGHLRGGDRVEHGAVAPVELLEDLRELGVTVVTQPSLVHDRGDDYLRDVDQGDLADLWRCGSLRRAGVDLAFGSDLPYGHADPWLAIATAVTRRTRGGAVLGRDEAVPARVALDAWLGEPLAPARPRTVARGAPADLVVLDRPLRDQLAAPTASAVRATIIAGEVQPVWM